MIRLRVPGVDVDPVLGLIRRGRQAMGLIAVTSPAADGSSSACTVAPRQVTVAHRIDWSNRDPAV